MKKKPDTRFIQPKSFMRFIFFMLSIPLVLPGNPVTSEPVFSTQFDSIMVFYHAELGNGSLEGTDDSLYAHTGVITDKNSGPSDWKYIITLWSGEQSEKTYIFFYCMMPE
ncbi:MAG: hypothetical protein ACP5D8_01200 [Fidelibacterota bacterium]